MPFGPMQRDVVMQKV